jgi:DNA-binding response OmpR family regulator
VAETRTRVAVVVEDDPDVRALLEITLTEAGFTCLTTPSGTEGIELVREHEPLLTTLDVGLPGIDGLEVARRMRAFSDTYIVIVSARTEEIDILMGLDAGADDYMKKPFRPRELRARIESMLRRTGYRSEEFEPGSSPVAGTTGVVTPPRPPGPPVHQATSVDTASDVSSPSWLSHNGLRVSPDMRLCELDGQPVDLTRSEFVLLVAIMSGERRVLSKSSLALDIRGESDSHQYVSDADRRVVESHLAHLRRKLGDPVVSPRFIETVRGVGYRLTAVQQL